MKETGFPESTIRFRLKKLERMGLVDTGANDQYGKMISVHLLVGRLFKKGGLK